MEYEWLGSAEPNLDESVVQSFGNVCVGRFGGSTRSGANKNEDALYIIQDTSHSWVFSLLIDAHNSSQSAELIIELIKSSKGQLVSILESESAFVELEPYVVSLFADAEFRKKCSRIQGEASCLLCFQRGSCLWWFSVGDCMAFLFHPELAKFNQYGLNQRQFFEWIGQVNAFDQPVPSYSSGRRQLRQGSNRLVLLTDGVLDTSDEYYSDYGNLYKAFVNDRSIETNLSMVLNYLKDQRIRDSASIICWEYVSDMQGLIPSD